MPLYLTISRGPRADRASPILASSDRAVIDAVLAAIARLDDTDGPTLVSAASSTGLHSLPRKVPDDRPT